MKNLKKLLSSTFLLFALIGFTQVQAQRVSATVNLSSFNINEVAAPGTQIDYAGSTSISANLRYFTKNKWAYRVGAGLDNLNYTVGDGVDTNYDAVRQDLKGIFGIEKHFGLGESIDIYPGVYVPIIVVGDDNIKNSFFANNIDNITNGGVRSGLGVVLGANVKLLKILRVGVEFDASYDNFSNGVRNGFNEKSLVPVKGINHKTAFTLGVAF